MSADRLDLETFERLLQIHGGRVERWPQTLREPLEGLLDGSERARARFEEAQAFEALLDAAPAVEPTADLMRRIASLPAQHPRPVRAAWWPFGSSLAPLLGWAAAAILGALVGLAEPLGLAPLGSEAPGAPLVEAFEGEESDEDVATEDWTEIAALASGAAWAPEEEE